MNIRILVKIVIHEYQSYAHLFKCYCIGKYNDPQKTTVCPPIVITRGQTFLLLTL